MKFIFLCFTLFAVIINTQAAPVIAVENKKTVDFGTFPANKKQSATFIIKNTGDVNLKIIRVRKTCACAVAKLNKKVIPSGQTTALSADIKKNSIAGSFSKSIYVESNASNSRFLRLILSGKAVTLVQVLPKEFLYLGTLTPGQSSSYSFKLKATQPDVKLKLMPAEANFPIQTSLKKLNTKEFSLTVTVTPEKFNDSLEAKILIDISSPKNWVPIEIKLMGKTLSKPPEPVKK
jgi:hypothetical protein